MTKEFVTYEQALALKELGFDEPCFGKYYESGKLADSLSYLHHNYFGQVNAPLYQQAFRWFRENHNLDSSVIREKVKVDGKWIKSKFYIYSIENNDEFPISLGFDLKDNATYEEAESACLDKLIEICKTKTND